MSSKKVAVILLATALALGTAIAAFAIDERGDNGYGHYYGCNYGGDGGHMNGSQQRYMDNGRHHRAAMMGDGDESHMSRHMSEYREHHMNGAARHMDDDYAPCD